MMKHGGKGFKLTVFKWMNMVVNGLTEPLVNLNRGPLFGWIPKKCDDCCVCRVVVRSEAFSVSFDGE